MNLERIKEIQQKTAYPDSISVQQALFQVWNECVQEAAEESEPKPAPVPSEKEIRDVLISELNMHKITNSAILAKAIHQWLIERAKQ